MTLLAALLACGDRPGDEPPALEGADLVAGTSLTRHGLLVVPQAGGAAQFRAIDDPSTIRWSGRIELPASLSAHSIGRSVVLRHAEGASLYTPSPETLAELSPVPDDARWVGSERGGALVGEGRALVVTRARSREIEVEGRILWAAPAADDRIVALVGGPQGTRLAVWEGAEEAPSKMRAVSASGPVALAGWGTEVVMPGEDGVTLARWSLPELERIDEADLAGPPVALAVSPSQHRIFAATPRRDRLATIDRYEWRTLAWTQLGGTPREVRTSPFGGRVLALDSEGMRAMRLGSDETVTVPGSWRTDLPVGLPGGRVLTLTEAGVHLFVPETGELAPVDGPTDAWWLPLRWGPRPPVSSAPVASETLDEEPEPAETVGREVGLTTMGRATERTVAAAPPRSRGAAPRPGAESAPSRPAPGVADRVPAGFYAVATSSRRLESLRALRRDLEGSGYRTLVLPRRDEANDIWFRLMVGPYDSRAAAEGIARELRRERGIEAWIREVGPGTRGPGR